MRSVHVTLIKWCLTNARISHYSSVVSVEYLVFHEWNIHDSRKVSSNLFAYNKYDTMMSKFPFFFSCYDYKVARVVSLRHQITSNNRVLVLTAWLTCWTIYMFMKSVKNWHLEIMCDTLFTVSPLLTSNYPWPEPSVFNYS